MFWKSNITFIHSDVHDINITHSFSYFHPLSSAMVLLPANLFWSVAAFLLLILILLSIMVCLTKNSVGSDSEYTDSDDDTDSDWEFIDHSSRRRNIGRNTKRGGQEIPSGTPFRLRNYKGTRSWRFALLVWGTDLHSKSNFYLHQ